MKKWNILFWFDLNDLLVQSMFLWTFLCRAQCIIHNSVLWTVVQNQVYIGISQDLLKKY